MKNNRTETSAKHGPLAPKVQGESSGEQAQADRQALMEGGELELATRMEQAIWKVDALFETLLARCQKLQEDSLGNDIEAGLELLARSTIGELEDLAGTYRKEYRKAVEAA
jgi:hypothetical protein